MATTGTTTAAELVSAAQVLGFVRDRQAAEDRAARDVLVAAAVWAEQHPPESIEDAATWKVRGLGAVIDTGVPLAGPGAPMVAEFAIAEFSAALGRTTASGRQLIADAVECQHRLPRLWRRVQLAGQAGGVAVWKARRIAQPTNGLTREAAAFVDAQVAPFAHKIGIAALDRLVEEAIARFMPAEARRRANDAADQRRFDIDHQQVTFNGTSRIEGELDLADAIDLDHALNREAANLKAAGSEDSHDVRRAKAAGEIARRQLSLDLAAAEDGEQNTEDDGDADGAETGADVPSTTQSSRTQAKSRTQTRARQVVLHVHLSEAALRGSNAGDFHLARVENHQQIVTAEQVRAWCANPDTTVTVKPILDVAEQIHVGAYEIPDRLHDQAAGRDLTCVFPWCDRPARGCDTDHVVAYGDGGQTATDNLAPLCRRHHRLKTHSPWGYTVFEPGTYLWTSPHGHQFLRDHTGTVDVSADRRYRSQHPPDE